MEDRSTPLSRGLFVAGLLGLVGLQVTTGFIYNWLGDARPNALEALDLAYRHLLMEPLGDAAPWVYAALTLVSAWRAATSGPSQVEVAPAGPDLSRAMSAGERGRSTDERRASNAAPPPRAPLPDLLAPGTALIVSRRALDAEGWDAGGWDAAPSWLGGLPRLGDAPWPRGRDGRPMVFLAQMDLGEVAADGPALPGRGALAFFIDTEGGGAVVHVRKPAATRLPPDAPVVQVPGGDIFPTADDPAAQVPGARRVFPRWPVEFVPLADARLEGTEAALAEVSETIGDMPAPSGARAVRIREFHLSASAMFGDANVRPHWWHDAQAYLATLETAAANIDRTLERARRRIEDRRRLGIPRLQARHAAEREADVAALADATDPVAVEAAQRELDDGERRREAAEAHARAFLTRDEQRLPELEKLARRLPRAVDAIATWVGDRDPWARMGDGDAQRLQETFRDTNTTFEPLVSPWVPNRLDDLTVRTVLAMATDPLGREAMPDHVRALIDAGYRLVAGGWHQMFGVGRSIQDEAEVRRAAGEVLLLQLAYDDMMGWEFGDVGAYRFWIDPADLARGRYERAEVTFEAH